MCQPETISFDPWHIAAAAAAYIRLQDERAFKRAFIGMPYCRGDGIKDAARFERSRISPMRRLLKSSFLWQFAGGFALGAVGLFTLHPVQGDFGAAPHTIESPLQ